MVECIPNFSEGRNREKVAQIAQEIESVTGVSVLDVHRDPDHNRSVITFAGSAEGVEEAAVRAAGRAAELIDLNRHEGVHPRIGATDVIPFVPLTGATMADCVAMARRAGESIWRRFAIPVYFYAEAAMRPSRVNLEDIRRGGFERLRREGLEEEAHRPDAGEPRLHPTAGATAVGARKPLIAFNVNLDSSDIEAAKKIAKAVRASSGGLPAVKAMGVLLKSRRPPEGEAQVSMNLTDFEKTSLAQAYEAAQREASRLGVSIRSSELVGLIPQKVLAGIKPEALRIENFHPQRILENRLAAVLAERR